MILDAKNINYKKQMALVGAIIGAAAFLLIYGFKIINPAYIATVRGGYLEKDIVQHYAGWMFYRDSPWQFPIGIAQNMNYPTGAYVGFSDSIPIFAVLFKLLSPLLPEVFQYFGIWAFLCSVLMGVSGALLLSLFTKSRVKCLLLTLLFVFAPVFLERQLRHSALGAQWLIVFALYLYFKQRRTGCYFNGGFVALCALAMAIHPYFVPMVFAVVFALLLEEAVLKRKLFKPILYLLTCFAATILTGFVFGAFAGGAESGSTSYGFFSMNLNALFNPSSLGHKWSAFLPELNQVLGNYDGFNYLGLGIIMGLAVVCVDLLLHVKKMPIKSFLKQHFGILFVCFCLTVFAVSNVVSVMGAVRFEIPLPEFITNLAGVFRSSGRMFYPVWYLLMLSVCVWVLRRPKAKWQALIAGLFLVLQLLDISPALLKKQDAFKNYSAPKKDVETGFWAEIAGEYQHINSLSNVVLENSTEVALFAAENHMTTNDVFLARYSEVARMQQLQEDLEELYSGVYKSDTLYITSTRAVYEEVLLNFADEAFCAFVNEKWYVMCPYTDEFKGYVGEDAVPAKDHTLRVTDFSDGLWKNGVLSTNKSVVCFANTAFASKRLDGMRALAANGTEYEISEVSYKDAGWIIVTLNIEDATVLLLQDLEGVPW